MGDGVEKMKWKVEIPSSDNVIVTIEGANLELIQYLKMYIVTVMKSYFYNGIPEELEYAVKHNLVRTHPNDFEFKDIRR